VTEQHAQAQASGACASEKPRKRVQIINERDPFVQTE